MPRRNGTRAVRRSSASGVRRTGSARWLSTVTAPWPGKCLSAPIVPASAMPRCAATTCAAATFGNPEAERVPITGSAGPRVTSATGASTEVKPSPRISRAPAREASRVSSGSRAAPAVMNEGEARGRVADPDHRAALLVHADERRVPTVAHGELHRGVDRRDLGAGVDVLRHGHDATEVQSTDHPRRRPGTPVAGHHDLAGELGQRQPTHERPGVPDLGAGRTPGRRLRRPLDLDHRTRPFPGRHGGSGGGRGHHRGAQEQHHDGAGQGAAHTRNSRNRRDSRVAEPPTSAGLTRPVAGVG